MTSCSAAVGKLTAEYGGSAATLNQIARTLNEWHSPYPQLCGEVREAAVSDLAALKYEVLQKVVTPLATLKHISSKNADYAPRKHYLHI